MRYEECAGTRIEERTRQTRQHTLRTRRVWPAQGYRFDFNDRSIAFPGDTAAYEAVAKMAKGADVLVHETMYVPSIETYIRGEIAKGRPIKFDDLMAHKKADHTPVEDVSCRWPVHSARVSGKCRWCGAFARDIASSLSDHTLPMGDAR